MRSGELLTKGDGQLCDHSSAETGCRFELEATSTADTLEHVSFTVNPSFESTSKRTDGKRFAEPGPHLVGENTLLKARQIPRLATFAKLSGSLCSKMTSLPAVWCL